MEPMEPMEPKQKQRRSVIWDEANLEANADYFRTHPVTNPIDEPKTPFNADEGSYEENDGEIPAKPTSWVAEYTEIARKAKVTAPIEAPRLSGCRGSLSIDTSAEVCPTAEEAQRRSEFRHMRRMVYADEGKKFMAAAGKELPKEDEEEGE